MAKKQKPTGPTPIDAIKHKDARVNIPTQELRGFVATDEAAPPKVLYSARPVARSHFAAAHAAPASGPAIWWYGISMVKVTFTVDDGTARTLRATAERLQKSQSLVVREAVAEYAARADRLTEVERRRMLAAIDQMAARPPTRPQAEVVREIRDIRRARRHGGRRHPAE